MKKGSSPKAKNGEVNGTKFVPPRSLALSIVRRHFPNVNRIIDAKENLQIEVTKKDEQHAKRKDMNECAMAVACKRVYHADGVIMARSRAYLIKGDLAVRFDVPDSVKREITSFDRGASFAPGFYHLGKITPGMTLEYKREHSDKGGNKPNKGIRKYHVTEGIRAVLGSAEDK